MKDSEVERLPFDGWPIPDSYLVEIGRVTVLWSSLESFLNLCLGKLAGFADGDPKPFVLVNHTRPRGQSARGGFPRRGAM